MKLLKERDNDGSFTVANAFVDTFLGLLSGNAVKLYLYIKRCYAEGNEYYAADAAAALRMTGEEIGSAFEELTLAGVAVADGDSLILRADSSLKALRAGRADDKLRKMLTEGGQDGNLREVVRTINNEFFAGKMTRRWYDFVNKCAAEYGFEPETIYILFVSCKGIREKGAGSDFFNYVTRVAENWYAEKVVTPEDVAARENRVARAREYQNFVAKKINYRRPFTQQETAVINGWMDRGITGEMLSVLLNDTDRVKAFTVANIDKEVAKWIGEGLKTAEDVAKYYERVKAERTAERSGSKSGNSGGASKGNAGGKHFGAERKYGDDFFQWLENRGDEEKKDGGAGDDGGAEGDS